MLRVDIVQENEKMDGEHQPVAAKCLTFQVCAKVDAKPAKASANKPTLVDPSVIKIVKN
jgi:hypothetical protein